MASPKHVPITNTLMSLALSVKASGLLQISFSLK